MLHTIMLRSQLFFWLYIGRNRNCCNDLDDLDGSGEGPFSVEQQIIFWC